MDAKEAWLLRVLGVGLAQSAQPGRPRGAAQPRDGGAPRRSVRPPDASGLDDTPPTGMAAWKAARAGALAALKALETAFRGSGDPEADAAIILLRAIQANLTETPATPAQVQELQNYIETDEIFLDAEEPNGFGVTVELRAPLLAALGNLRAAQDGAHA